MPKGATKQKSGKATKKAEKKATPASIAAKINKHYKKPVLRLASDPIFQITRIPSGVLAVDYLTKGGFARNRHNEIFGSANVGKTALTYRFIAMAQSLGLNCAFFDVENGFDPKFAASLGVDLSKLYMGEHEYGNQLIDIMTAELYSGVFDVIVLDSIAALLPKGEYEKATEAGSFGAEHAKLMSTALRKLTAANKRTCIVYINQTRDNLGVIFGKRSNTTGGRAMGFYAGMRIEMVRTEAIKRPGRVIDPAKGDEARKPVIKGHRILLKVDKNKTGGAKNADEGTLVFDYDLGNFDPIEDLIYIGRRFGWIKKSGDTWSLVRHPKSKKKGRANFKKWLVKSGAADTLKKWIITAGWDDEDDDDEEEDE